MSVSAVPPGYHSLTPYLIIRDATRAMNFYRTVFGAEEIMRIDMPGGRIGHAEMKIGDSFFMLADEFPDMEFHSPQGLGGSPVGIVLYVENVDEVFQRALDAGATEMKPLRDQFYGDRSGTVVDPFGHLWTIATHIEDVSREEIDRRMAAMGGPPE